MNNSIYNRLFRRVSGVVTMAVSVILLAGCGASVRISGVPSPIPLSDLCGARGGCGVAGTSTAVATDAPLVRGDPPRYVELLGVVDDVRDKQSLLRSPRPCEPSLDPAKVQGAADPPIFTGHLSLSSSGGAGIMAELKGALKNVQALSSASFDAMLDAALSRGAQEDLAFETRVYTLDPTLFSGYVTRCQKPGQHMYVRRSVALISFQGTANTRFKSTLKAGLTVAAAGNAAIVDASGQLKADIASDVDKNMDVTLAQMRYLIVAGWDTP